MSTKTVQTSNQQEQQSQSGSNNSSWANQFAPGSLQNYQTLQGGYVPGLMDMINNPLGNPMFQAMSGQLRAQVGGNNAASMQQLTNNMNQFGGASSPFMASQMLRLGRSSSGQQAQGQNNLLIQAMQNRMQALGMAGSYNPLVTGGNQNQSYTGNSSGTMNGTQTQQQSGLGTWLPQLLGAGLGFATGGLGGGGGLMGMLGGGSKGGSTGSAGSFGNSTPFRPLVNNPSITQSFPTNTGLGSNYSANPFMPNASFASI